MDYIPSVVFNRNPLIDPPPKEIKELIERGAMFFVNHSGGKDSQAMFHYIHRHIPKSQIIVVHALLPEVEWDGVEDHVRNTTLGIPVMTCKSRRTLLQMIEERGMFPSPKNRQCTSDLKRGPIERTVRSTGQKLVVNCMGMRAQESSSRSKLETFKYNSKNTNSKREWFDWLPIHHWLIEEVFGAIASVGQKPHWAYSKGMTRLSCCFCLSGDTEIVTRYGIREISKLAGEVHDILIPKKTPFGLSTVGTFVRTPILNFGKQYLYKITLGSSNQLKTVYATEEHRWFVVTKKGNDNSSQEKETRQLIKGDILKKVKSQKINGVEVPFAIAQGFVYGDGTIADGDRPASLAIYDQNKDGAILQYFSAHKIARHGNGRIHIYGLPRTWKELPDIHESRSFLLSWLAGYFAADGCVSKIGAVRIDSADINNIKFVRDIAAICGIGYGNIRSVDRLGSGKFLTSIYSLNLNPCDLPDWFFKIKTHHERILSFRARKTISRNWRVLEVFKTDRLEEVFCAVVENSQAFGLADGIMTGNCIMASKQDLTTAAMLNPELYKKYVSLERTTGQVMMMPTKLKGRQTLEQITGVSVS